MKIKYFTHVPSRVGQIIPVRDLEEGEILRTKIWGRSKWTYYKKDNDYFWVANRKRYPIWHTEYSIAAVERYLHLLSFEGEVIS